MSRELWVELAKLQGPSFALLQWHATGTFLSLCFIEGLLASRHRRHAASTGSADATASWKRPPPQLVTDMFYWLFSPLFRTLSRFIVAGMLMFAAAHLGGKTVPDLLHGTGVLARQPTVLIVIELLLLSDVMSYWAHRLFHTVPLFWRFHAIHHSATQIRWSTTARVHPINEFVNYVVGIVPCVLLGFPLEALLWTLPFLSWYAIAAHTAWNPPMGPLRAVFVTPHFHQWHHTHSNEGGNKNFGNMFCLWDRMFGSHYYPSDRLPSAFGLDNERIPENYLVHFMYPFRARQLRADAPAPAKSAPASTSPNAS